MRMMHNRLGWTASMIIGLAAAAPARAEWVFELRKEANRLADAGDLRGSLAAFDKLLERRPRDVESHLRRGNLLLRLNRPEQAVTDFDAAIRYTPWSPAPYIDRGIGRVMLGEYERARKDFSWALVLLNNPLNRNPSATAAAHSGLGQVAHRQGEDEQAFQEYDLAIHYNPGDPSGYLGRGQASAGLGKLDAAIQDYSRAIGMNPSLGRAYTFRGDALSQLGRDDEAIGDLEQALRLDPGDEQARSFRGSLLAKRGETVRAIEDFDEVIHLDPGRAAAYKDRGGLLVRLGRYDLAIKDLDEAIRLDSRRASAYQNRGAAYNGLGQYERALEDLEEAIRLDPNNAGARTNAGLALFGLGQYERAIESLTEAIRLDPKNAVVHLNRAGVYARLGMTERAVEDYDTALRLDPRAVVARVGLGNAHESLGRPEDAIREYDMAIQLNPSDPGVYCTRGNAKRSEGDWRGAIEDFTKAIELDPKRAEAYVLRGWSRFSADRDGADTDARAYLVLQKRPDASTPYMAILGALGARRAGREPEALAFLDEALRAADPNAWPTPLLRYLRREIPAQILLDSAYDDTQKTEAHAFLGVDRLQAGDLTGAIAHFRWVRDRGASRSSATDLARTTLQRLEGMSAERPRP